MQSSNVPYQSKFLYLVIIIFLLSTLCGLQAQEINPPTCYGGKRLFKEFIKEEMFYPEKALKNNIEGTVELSFIVKPDGAISDLNIEKSVSKELDDEAKRIFRKILWKPATELGKPIAYLHSLEIKFNIKRYNKICKSRGYDQNTYPIQPIDSSNKVYPFIDIDISPKPIFTSQDYNFSNFVGNNLKYPEAAFKQNISGMVKLKFVVEPSGRISNIEVEKSVGGGCTEEAIRVIKLTRWNPGLFNNLAVRTFMCLELTFDLANQTVGGKIPAPGQIH